jgi:hypothetical protein
MAGFLARPPRTAERETLKMTTEHADSSEKPITFVLIHGTFAPRAGWTLDGSALTSSLAETALSCGAKASFKNVLWTGKNRLVDRYRASEQLDLIVSNAAENERFIYRRT